MSMDALTPAAKAPATPADTAVAAVANFSFILPRVPLA
jgi:hypothetical protein